MQKSRTYHSHQILSWIKPRKIIWRLFWKKKMIFFIILNSFKIFIRWSMESSLLDDMDKVWDFELLECLDHTGKLASISREYHASIFVDLIIIVASKNWQPSIFEELNKVFGSLSDHFAVGIKILMVLKGCQTPCHYQDLPKRGKK